MAENIIIEFDDKKFRSQLGAFQKKMPSIAKKMMNAVNGKIKREVRTEMRKRKYDTKNSDGMYKNLFSFSSKDYRSTIWFKRSGDFYTPATVTYGAHITAKNGKYLTFQINNKWIKVQSVAIPSKPILEPIAESYWKTGKANEIMEAKFQTELDKLFKD